MSYDTVGSGQVDNSPTLGWADYVSVQSGGTVSGALINAGYLQVNSGGYASSDTVSGGYLEVYSGAAASTDLLSTGYLLISSGGIETAATVRGGYLEVAGTQDYATVLGGFFIVETGGEQFNAVAGPGEVFEVSAGGAAAGTTIEPGAIAMIYSGGTLTSPLLQSGSSVDFGAIAFAAGGTASLNSANDVLTITEGGIATTLQLSGDYTGQSFSLASDNGFLSSGGAPGTRISVNTASGAAISSGTNTGANTIFGGGSNNTYNVGNPALYFGGNATSATINITDGPATLVGGGAETVNATFGNELVFGGTGLLTFYAGHGASTVVAGAGGASLQGGQAASLFFGRGDCSYMGATATDTIVGYLGSLTATGAGTGILVFTGTSGHSLVSTGSGSSTVVGFGASDSLIATGQGADFITAGASADTIDAKHASGADIFFAFGQGDVVTAGSGPTTISSYIGSQTLTGGVGSTAFEIVNSGSNRSVVVGGFDATRDSVRLQGYVSGAADMALQQQTSVGGNAVLTLGDGTRVTFLGVATLASGAVV